MFYQFIFYIQNRLFVPGVTLFLRSPMCCQLVVAEDNGAWQFSLFFRNKDIKEKNSLVLILTGSLVNKLTNFQSKTNQ